LRIFLVHVFGWAIPAFDKSVDASSSQPDRVRVKLEALA
jgi:hypothetical protein